MQLRNNFCPKYFSLIQLLIFTFHLYAKIFEYSGATFQINILQIFAKSKGKYSKIKQIKLCSKFKLCCCSRKQVILLYETLRLFVCCLRFRLNRLSSSLQKSFTQIPGLFKGILDLLRQGRVFGYFSNYPFSFEYRAPRCQIHKGHINL